MRPVDQTRFGTVRGNCLAACIASILELRIEDIEISGTDETWIDGLAAWMEPRGLYPVCFSLNTTWRPVGLYILAGKSPRGDFLHAVVARGDEVLHDPHPSRAGVLTHTDATLLVPIDFDRFVPADATKTKAAG